MTDQKVREVKDILADIDFELIDEYEPSETAKDIIKHEEEVRQG